MNEYKQIDAGKYNHKIQICQTEVVTDAQGFQSEIETVILSPYANIKTTKGITIIKNNSDFEKALTNFTIRYPKTQITREMVVKFRGKTYEIQYLNNVDEACVELEIQAKEVTH
jgi:SPP1 family predicted phage head-tail adaptor